MYAEATPSVQINGYLYETIPVQCAVRQGCPMIMALFALCLYPFLRYFVQKLPGIRIGRLSRPTVTVAYVDDVTIFVTSVSDFATITEAIKLCERASGAKLNPRKSKALAVGGWCTQESPLGIAYHQSVTILGVTFWSTIEQTINYYLARLTAKVRAQARDAYVRGQFLANRIRYVNTFYLKFGTLRKSCRHRPHKPNN
jgi:hypothetical protein